MKQLNIGPNDQNQRLDKFLQKALPLLPVPLLYKALRLKRIKLNGRRCDGAMRLAEGDVVTLYLSDEFFTPPLLPFLAAPAQIDAIYEDQNLLLVDKAPGVIVHEDDKEQHDTLIHRIQHYLYNKGEYRPEEENSFAPALCNRIDRNTGGIVIAAKNFQTLQLMNQKIKDRELVKLYLCVAHGYLAKKEGQLKNFLLKDAGQNMVRVFEHPVPGGKTALTNYRVLAEKNNLSLLEVELLTGRTHQIRAQLAFIGHPLLGDAKYSRGAHSRNTALSTPHQALYAYRLCFHFSDQGGHLAYLNGKDFQVQNVPFQEFFHRP